MGLLQNLIINLRVRNSGLKSGLREAEGSMLSFSNMVKTRVGPAIAAAFSVSAIAKFTTEALRAADRIDNFAQRLRLTRREVDALDARLKEGGLTEGVQALRGPLGSIDARREAALGGDQQSQIDFARFGITSQELGNQNLNASRLFAAIVNSVQRRGGKVTPQMNAALRRIGSEQLPDILATIGANPLTPPPLAATEAQIRDADEVEQMLTRAGQARQSLGIRGISTAKRGVEFAIENQNAAAFLPPNLQLIIAILRDIKRLNERSLEKQEQQQGKARQPFN